MGKLVNVVLPGGRVVSVPEEVANKISGNDVAHTESLPEAGARSTQDINAERSSGPVEGIKAAAEGFADAASLGAYGQIKSWADPVDAANSQIRAQERPGARLAGELGAVLSPTGILGKTAKVAGEALPLTSIAGAAGGVGGRLAEGAVYGIGGNISHANITGDPLSIEGVVQDAGIGALLNFGLGKLSDGILGVANKAKARIAAEEAGEKASNIFQSTPESYNELVAANKATVQAAKVAQKDWDKAAAAYYDGFKELGSDPAALRQIIVDVDVVERKALNQLTKGRRMADLPLKSNPGEPAAALSDVDRAALTRVRKILGDARVDATKAFAAGNHGLVVTKLEGAIQDAKTIIPELELPDLPNLSKFGDRPTIPDIVSLPKDLKGFARLHPDTIAKLANSAEPGSALAQSIDKFTADLGLESSGTASATLAGTHATLSSMVNSVVEKEASGSSLLDTLRNNSKRAVRYGLGRMADTGAGGGFLGASARTVVGGLVGYGLDGTEGALIGASVLNSRAAVRTNIGNIFARYGQGAAAVVSKLGPVTSYLKTQFPSGEPDKETDIRKLALNRVNDLQATAHVATDASFSAIQSLLNQPGDIAHKIHSLVVGAVGLMTETAPKDPGLATNMFNSYWKPTHSEALKLAHTMEAVFEPMKAIERLIAGKSDPSAATALWNIWPAHMQEAATALSDNAQYMGKLTREQSSALGNLFRIPLNGFQQPEVIAQLQSYYLPKPQQSSGPSPSKMPTGNPTGRPPAVSSPSPNQSRVSQLQR
jgi:hypothetical protein